MKRNQIIPRRGLSTLSITTANPLPDGTQGAAYSLTFTATGGQGNYSWALLKDYSGTGLTLTSGGVLSGSSAASGLCQFVVSVTDGVSLVQKMFVAQMAVAPAIVIITASPLPSASPGVAYSKTIAAVGGQLPYTWSITSASPNTGSWMSIGAATGILSGTPGTFETETIVIKVQDNVSATASKTFSLTVSVGPSISTASALTTATQHSFFAQTFAASGGTPPYTWTIDDDGTAYQFDPSLHLETGSGVFSGLPELPGSYSFTLVCTDSVGAIGTKVMTQTVNSSGAFAIIQQSDLTPYNMYFNPFGTNLALAWGEQLHATGGQPPYTWAYVSGTLPGSGTGTLKWTSSGALCTPNVAPYYVPFNGTAGAYPIVMRCTDSLAATSTVTVNINVTDTRSGATVVPTLLTFTVFNNMTLFPVVGQAYSFTVGAQGGTAPYTFSILTGQSLNSATDLTNAGFTLNSSTGVISGTAVAENHLRLWIRCTDNVGATVSELFYMQIKPNTNLWAGAVIASKPFRYMKTTYALPGGTVWNVTNKATLVTALTNSAQGDVIVMAVTSTDVGGKYTGPFTLPQKAGNSWIYIISANYYNNTPSIGTTIPSPGTRVNDSTDLANMPWVTTANINDNCFLTSGIAHHWRFVGIHMSPGTGITTYGLLAVDSNQTTYAQTKHHFLLDRCTLKGDESVAANGTVRLFHAEGAYMGAVDSCLRSACTTISDAQCIQGINAIGPIKIDNCLLEGAGENVMFGGGDATLFGCLTSDITISNCNSYKPPDWMYLNKWTCKNLMEFKIARRVWMYNIRFECLWNIYNNLNQRGMAWLWRGANQDGAGTWNCTRDLTLENSYMDKVNALGNIIACDQRATFGGGVNQARFTMRNLVVEAGVNVGTQGPNYMQFGAGLTDCIFDHVTYRIRSSWNTYSAAPIFLGSPLEVAGSAPGLPTMLSAGIGKGLRFVWTNVIYSNGYGIYGSGIGPGNLTTILNNNMGTYVFENNVAIPDGVHAVQAGYPTGNFFPADEPTVQFTNATTKDFRLAGGSPYKALGKTYAGLTSNIGATIDGSDIGAPVASINGAETFPFQIITASLAGGTSGVAYSQIVYALGGYWPFTYAITSGSLPTGLSRPPDSTVPPIPVPVGGPTVTPYPGTIAGTPTVPGTYPFTIAFTDARGISVSQVLSITIA